MPRTPEALRLTEGDREALEPLPVLLSQRHRRLRPRQTVPPVLALRQRDYTNITLAV